jgi:hypothetical protein
MKKKKKIVKSHTTQGGAIGKDVLVALVRRPKIVITKP